MTYLIFYKAIDVDVSHKNEDSFVEGFWGWGFFVCLFGGGCGFFSSLLPFWFFILNFSDIASGSGK